MLHDKDIREPLFEYLEDSYGKVRIIEEKQMGKSRADVVMVVPDALYGIEIKSDADTYTRLERQVKDYDKFYDYNIVVVGSTHAKHIEEHVPKHWGILSVEKLNGKMDFLIIRDALPNPKLKIKNKIKILWRPELAIMQEHFGMPKYKAQSKKFVQNKILERIPDKITKEDFHKQFSEILFERDYNTIAEMIETYRKENRR